jgi:hypothetical protein
MRPLPKYYLYRIIQSCTYQDPFKILQWVENNPTNIRIFPTNIRLSPQGSWYYADGSFEDVNTDVAGC